MFRVRFGAIAIAAAAAFVAAPAFAAVDLGNLSVASPVSYTKSFDLAFTGSFADLYTFHLDSAATVGAGTTQRDGYVLSFLGLITMIKDITVSSIGLDKYDTTLGAYTSVTSTSSVAGFNFNSLTGGDYRMTVNGNVQWGDFFSIGGATNGGVASYTLTAGTSSVAAATPEASELFMAGLGLVGVGFWARRQKRA
ncbi:MAG: hypothetical protein RI907_1836 [Pseudomonadota bacterium]|jgi:hypothetical protein